MQQAQIEVQAGKVLGLQESPAEPADFILSGKTILPGLVNAHTHLEFSDLEAPIPASSSFAEWIASVIRHRRNQSQSLTDEQLRQARSAAMRRGLTEAWRNGTSALVDIATQPLDPSVFTQNTELNKQSDLHGQSDLHELHQQCNLDTTRRPTQAGILPNLAQISAMPELFCLPEVIGLDNERFQQTLDWAQSLQSNFHDKQSKDSNGCLAGTGSLIQAFGISPHAPYSLIHPLAMDKLTKLDRSTLVAMHVAESLDELEWAKFGSGSFRDVYSRVGLPLEQDRMQIEQAIELLSRFDQALLVHGNYLTQQQLDHIAQSTTAVVYCPRTHRHFKHQPYPLAEILRRGIPLLLGTDSRASNPDLDMWQECRQAALAHPQWPAADLLAAATTQAAEYLGIADRVGSLRPGKRFVARCLDTPTGATPANLLDHLLRS